MEVLNLTKGNGMLNLTKAAPGFKTIKGVLNWDMHPTKGKSLTDGFDLDIFAFILGKDEKISSQDKVVYFNNKTYKNGIISIPVDNRDGEGDDDEFIDMQLNLVDDDIVDVFITIADAATRQQNFGMVANAKFTLMDAEKNTIIQQYNLTEYTNETAIHIGRFSKNGTEWNFDSIGLGAVANPNDIFSAYM